MKTRTIIVLVILFLVLLIAGINWEAFSEPIPIFLLFTTVNLPIGLSMLAVLGILCIIFLALVGRTQTLALFEQRNLNKELKKAQKLANKEEESRLRELRVVLDEEIEFIHRKLDLIMEHMNIGAPPEQFAPHGEIEIQESEGQMETPPPKQLKEGPM